MPGCCSKPSQATRTTLDCVGQPETPPVRGSHCEGGTPACAGALSSNHGSRGLRLLSADGSSTDSVRVIDAEPFHPQGVEAREWRFTAHQCQTSRRRPPKRPGRAATSALRRAQPTAGIKTRRRPPPQDKRARHCCQKIREKRAGTAAWSSEWRVTACWP